MEAFETTNAKYSFTFSLFSFPSLLVIYIAFFFRAFTIFPLYNCSCMHARIFSPFVTVVVVVEVVVESMRRDEMRLAVWLDERQEREHASVTYYHWTWLNVQQNRARSQVTWFEELTELKTGNDDQWWWQSAPHCCTGSSSSLSHTHTVSEKER